MRSTCPQDWGRITARRRSREWHIRQAHPRHPLSWALVSCARRHPLGKFETLAAFGVFEAQDAASGESFKRLMLHAVFICQARDPIPPTRPVR